MKFHAFICGYWLVFHCLFFTACKTLGNEEALQQFVRIASVLPLLITIPPLLHLQHITVLLWPWSLSHSLSWGGSLRSALGGFGVTTSRSVPYSTSLSVVRIISAWGWLVKMIGTGYGVKWSWLEVMCCFRICLEGRKKTVEQERGFYLTALSAEEIVWRRK